MANNFPTIAVFKEAISLPLQFPKEVVKSFGLIALGLLASLILGMIGGFIGNQILAAILPMIIVILMLGIFIHIFNRWVRIAGLGIERVEFSSLGDAVKAAAINAVKFFLIGVLIGIATYVLSAVATFLGVVAPIEADMSIFTDPSSMTMSQFLNFMMVGATSNITFTILQTMLACGIYSVFSSNLTNTALAADYEALTHPHNVDFGIVLFLVYLVFLVPSTLAAVMGFSYVWLALYVVLGFFIMFAVPAAHGVRFRCCLAENNTEPTASSEASDSNEDAS